MPDIPIKGRTLNGNVGKEMPAYSKGSIKKLREVSYNARVNSLIVTKSQYGDARKDIHMSSDRSADEGSLALGLKRVGLRGALYDPLYEKSFYRMTSKLLVFTVAIARFANI